MNDAESAARGAKDPYCGRLSLACASTTLLYHLPEILAQYSKQYPNVELAIIGGTIQEVAATMWSGSVDLAIVVPPLNSPAIEKVVLCEEGFVGIVPSSHPLARKPRLTVHDVRGERFILQRAGQNTRKLIDRYLYHQQITPKMAIELAETEAIKALVARGLGVSILPESAFVRSRDRRGLRIFKIPKKDLRRSLAVVYPRPRPLRPPAVAMIELLQQHFRVAAKASAIDRSDD